MFPLKKRFARLGNQFDAAMERFLFHHKFLGLLLLCVGGPLITLAAVCLCSTALILPMAWVLGLA